MASERIEIDGATYAGPLLTGAASALVPRALALIPEQHRGLAAVVLGRPLPPAGDERHARAAGLRLQLILTIAASPDADALAREVLAGWVALSDDGARSLAQEWDTVFSGRVLHPVLLMLGVLDKAGFFRLPGIGSGDEKPAESPPSAGGV